MEQLLFSIAIFYSGQMLMKAHDTIQLIEVWDDENSGTQRNRADSRAVASLSTRHRFPKML